MAKEIPMPERKGSCPACNQVVDILGNILIDLHRNNGFPCHAGLLTDKIHICPMCNQSVKVYKTSVTNVLRYSHHFFGFSKCPASCKEI